MGSSPRNTYKSLYQHLQKEFRSGVISLPDDREILVQLIYSALLENRPAAVALEAFETIENSFIDWNELRVSRARELCDLLPMLSDAANSCERLRQTLQVIFQATYKFDLEEWREKGEDAFSDYLGTIPYVTPFMKSYTIAVVFRKRVVPLDEGALRVLRLLDLIEVDEENHEVPIGLERAFSKTDMPAFAKMLHELGAMLMDESTSIRARKILKAVDPDSAQRSDLPLVETEELDPFQIARELANKQSNRPMKISFDAEMEDVEEEDFTAEDDSLEEPLPMENADESPDDDDDLFDAPAPKKKGEKKPKDQEPAQEKAKKPAEEKAPAKEKEPAEVKKPAKAKKPAEEKAPVKAKKPAEEKAPAKEKEPAEVKKPAKAKKPAEVKAHAKAKKPAEVKAPVKAKKPAEVKAPVKAKKPAEVKAPVRAKKPAEVKAPAKAKKPAAAKTPAKAKKPPEVKAPAKAKKRPETKVPAKAKKPPETKKPASKSPAKPSIQKTLFSKGVSKKKSGGKKK